MRTPVLSSASYTPNQIPTDPADLPRFLREEFDRISAAVGAVALGHLDRTYVMPAKPRDGDLRYLDSTIAPGAVLGAYIYKAGVWTLLG